MIYEGLWVRGRKKSDTTASFLFSDKKKIFIQVTNNKFY